MRRKTLDILLTTGGVVVAAVLLISGLLLTWGHNFATDEVNSQLSAQKIFFPKAGSEQLNDPKVKPYIEQYAGQQLTTGDQAKAFADHYIKVHLDESTGGRTYSELSTQSRQNPGDAELAGLVQTAFRGETLRGMLLNAYAWDTMGKIAWYASIAAYAGAALMLVLSLLGFAHLRRVSPDAEVFVGNRPAEKVTA